MASILGRSIAPASVSVTPLRLRRIRQKPYSSSMALRTWLILDWVESSASAALVRLPSSAVFTKASYCLILMEIAPFHA